MTSGGPLEPESLSELARYAHYMFNNFEKQLNRVATKIDQMDVVSKDQHREDLYLIRSEINDVKADIETYRMRQTAQARWIIGSLVLPLVGVILTVYSMLQGSSP